MSRPVADVAVSGFVLGDGSLIVRNKPGMGTWRTGPGFLAREAALDYLDGLDNAPWGTLYSEDAYKSLASDAVAVLVSVFYADADLPLQGHAAVVSLVISANGGRERFTVVGFGTDRPNDCMGFRARLNVPPAMLARLVKRAQWTVGDPGVLELDTFTAKIYPFGRVPREPAATLEGEGGRHATG